MRRVRAAPFFCQLLSTGPGPARSGRPVSNTRRKETFMIKTKIALALSMATLLSGVEFADTVAEKDQQRDVNQQQRIEQGLKSGELNTKEAGRLEREQQHIDRMEAHDLKDGHMSAAEQARLDKAQNAASADIHKQKHDAQM